MTNTIETILISPVSYPLPLPMVIDVAPEIETELTDNNFWDLLEREEKVNG